MVLSAENRQCGADADCAPLGSGLFCDDGMCRSHGGNDGGVDAGDPAWSCVGQVEWPQGVAPATFSFRAEDFSKAPITPSSVRACNRLDVTCANPVTTDFDTFEGVSTVLVPGGFDGFFEVEVPDKLPSLLYVSRPITEDIEYGAITCLAESDMALIAGIAQANPPSPERGHVFLLSLDCQLEWASGVEFRVDATEEDTESFYTRSGLPSSAALNTDQDATGGYINLPPGIRTFEALRTETGVVHATVSAVVRQQSITYIDVPPTPE